tara:strand:- start:30 stop:323 length:294 start_codon:yes stop_codon:yes gene_type:complete
MTGGCKYILPQKALQPAQWHRRVQRVVSSLSPTILSDNELCTEPVIALYLDLFQDRYSIDLRRIARHSQPGDAVKVFRGHLQQLMAVETRTPYRTWF